ncbi:hypothetical protein NO758_00187 [Planktothrix agardhii]|nr:hypothetical protein NO758_00187 [Planktothrix agardhii]
MVEFCFFQIEIDSPSLLAAINCPSGLKLTELNRILAAIKEVIKRPLLTSHRLTVLSLLAEAKILLSGLKLKSLKRYHLDLQKPTSLFA